MDWTLQIGSFELGILDIVVLVIFFSTSIGCTVAGFSRSAAKNIGWFLCYPLSLFFTGILAKYLRDNSNIGTFFSTLLAFAIMSVIVFSIFNILGSLLGNLLSGVGLGAIDSILGFVWGLVVSMIVSGVLIYIIANIAFIDFAPLLDKSYMYSWISPLFPSTKEFVMGVMDEFL